MRGTKAKLLRKIAKKLAGEGGPAGYNRNFYPNGKVRFFHGKLTWRGIYRKLKLGAKL